MNDNFENIIKYLPIHLWKLKEISKDRVIDSPILKDRKSQSIIFPEKLKKPCSKLIFKW